MQYDKYFYLGYFTKSRGLKGELQLFFEFASFEDLDLSVLFVEFESHLVPYFVRDYQLMSNRTGFFFLEDINHIDDAQGLLRKKVYLSKDKMPEVDSITDYTGFLVVDLKLGTLGVISEIQVFPQQEIASIQYKGKSIMFPLVEDLIEDIDLEEKCIRVNLPEGLLDVYL